MRSLRTPWTGWSVVRARAASRASAAWRAVWTLGSLEGGARGGVPAALGVVGGAVAECALGLGVEGVLGVGEQFAQESGFGEVGRALVGDRRGRRVVQEFGGRLGGDEKVVALRGDGPLDVLGESGEVVGGQQPLGAAAFACFEGDGARLPGGPRLGQGDDAFQAVAVVGGVPAPRGGEGPVEQGHGIGGGHGLQEPAVVGAVGVHRNALAGPRAADMALVAVPDGDGERGAGGADGRRAHAELAGGDARDGREEPLAAVAEAAREGAVGPEAAVLALEQGPPGQGEMVEGGEAVVDRGVRAEREGLDRDMGEGAVAIGERRQEEKDAVVTVVDEEAGGDDGRLRTAQGAGVGHELRGARMRGVQDEAARRGVVAGGRLQGGGVVAVVELGAQERADTAEGGELAQVPRRVVGVVEDASEEEVVVDARDGGEAAAPVDDRGPFVQSREQGRVVGEGHGVVERVVDQTQPGVGLLGPLLGRRDRAGAGRRPGL